MSQHIDLTDDEVSELYATLVGTCESLEYGLKDLRDGSIVEDNLSSKSLEAIDECMFLCDLCGWWYAIEEQAEDADETRCQECQESHV
jgi:hypothetical protein